MKSGRPAHPVCDFSLSQNTVFFKRIASLRVFFVEVWDLVSFSEDLELYLYLSIASTTDALRVVYLLLASFMIPPTIEQH